MHKNRANAGKCMIKQRGLLQEHAFWDIVSAQ